MTLRPVVDASSPIALTEVAYKGDLLTKLLSDPRARREIGILEVHAPCHRLIQTIQGPTDHGSTREQTK